MTEYVYNKKGRLIPVRVKMPPDPGILETVGLCDDGNIARLYERDLSMYFHDVDLVCWVCGKRPCFEMQKVFRNNRVRSLLHPTEYHQYNIPMPVLVCRNLACIERTLGDTTSGKIWL